MEITRSYHSDYMELTQMQMAAASAINDNKNIILLSPTGSGKTFAFLLPLIDRLRDEEVLQAVVVVPTRELAQQIEQVCKDALKQKALKHRCYAVYGGRPAMDEHRVLREVKPQIIIATPGRLLDHVGKENLEISGVRTLVIDEYDKCLELGFKDEMTDIAERFAHCRQMVLTSATKMDDDAWLTESRAFETLDFLDAEHLAQRINIYIVPSPEKDKLATLSKLLTTIGHEQSMVFVAHRESAERIGKHLAQEGFSAIVYHGGMEQTRRERSLYRFRAGASLTLVSTDLAARGLDIPDVKHVIHYHLPLDAASFTHRTGRTARWTESGSAYLIVGPEETVPDFVEDTNFAIEPQDVSEAIGKVPQAEWTLLYIGRGKKDKLAKSDILGFLCKKGQLKSSQIGRIDVAAHASYVAVKRTVVKGLLKLISNEKIKGMKTIIEPIRH